MNLHDWIDELCDVLEIEADLDEALVLDVARVAAHAVQRPAAPLTTFLLGYAAGQQGAGPAEIEALAERASGLAAQWDRPAGAPDPEVARAEVAIPDDSGIDHSADDASDLGN